MQISDVEILPGETKNVTVNIARLPSHSPIGITITVSRSLREGPTLLLMGGLHGDEINGVEIVRRFIEQGYNIPERGTTICVPILNVFGFIHFSRYVPDGKDVNRSFPGNKNGSLAARVAYYLMKDIIPLVDIGVDFHTGGADRTNYPQIRCVMTNTKNAALAKIFHAPFSLHAPFRPKSLRWAAAKMNKTILVYEGGESSRFDEEAIQHGIDGTRRLMKHLAMRTEQTPVPNFTNVRIKSSSWIRAKASGLFLSEVKSGQKVKKNQIVGYISDPFGEFRKAVRSSATGYVIGLNNNPILHAGDAVMHIGVFKDSGKPAEPLDD